jgi:hypothetical protein
MSLMHARHRFHAFNSRRPLIDLCVGYAFAECEDGRDKVFGLLAFTRDYCKNNVTVDYSSSLTEFSQRLLCHHHSSLGDGSLLQHSENVYRDVGITRQDLKEAGFSPDIERELFVVISDDKPPEMETDYFDFYDGKRECACGLKLADSEAIGRCYIC